MSFLFQSNLSWVGYGGDHIAGKVVSNFIVLFPAIDVISAYPLNAITLGNNIMAAYYGAKTTKVEKDRCRRLPFRLLASVPPIVGACLISDLGSVLSFTGILGLLIALVIPPFLHLSTLRSVRKRWGANCDWVTPYTGCVSVAPVAWLVLLTAVCITTVVFGSLLITGQ